MNPFAALAQPLVHRPGDATEEGDAAFPKRRRAGRATMAAIPEVENPWRLKPSQCAIMAGLSNGKSNDEIASELGISPKTPWSATGQAPFRSCTRATVCRLR